MDFLDENFSSLDESFDLTQFAGTQPVSALPSSTVKNRASTTALLSSTPDKLVENYQLLVKEGTEGSKSAHDQLIKSVIQSAEKVDMQGLMSVLADRSVPFDVKRDLVSGVRSNHLLRDAPTLLLSNSLAAPSKGENYEQEAVRVSVADAIAEIYDARVQVQGLVNAHGATLQSANAETVGEMAELWVMPFGNNVSTGKINKGRLGANASVWDVVKGYLLPGSTTVDIREHLANLPPSKRAEAAQQVINSIKSNSSIIFGNENQFAQFEKASSIFDEGGYSNTQAFLDNMAGLLDVVGLGFLFRTPKGAARLNKADKPGTDVVPYVEKAEWELVDDRPRVPRDRQIPFFENKLEYVRDQVKRIEYNSVVRQENPASPANIIQQANPEKARNIHEIVSTSNTDEVAEALYGTTKEQAIINDLFPQVATQSGAVTSKVFDIEQNLRQKLNIDDALVEMIHSTGATYYTNAEKAQARANVVRDYSTVEGLTVNDAMSSFTVDGGRIKIGAVYGAGDGAWLRAEDALQQAKFALRNQGIRDDEIIILQKKGLDYVPVELKNVAGKDGNYLVRIETAHDIDPTDITRFEQFDVKRNLFDRIGPTVSQNTGSVSRYVFDAASMLHPTYTGAAVVASDATAKFDKFMLRMASDYSDRYMTLDSTRKAKMDNYIREANYNGIKLDVVDLKARGFNDVEIDALKAWRKFWDGHFYLENYDLIKTLNAQGYELFKNSNAELYVKPIAKNQNVGAIYDPALDKVVVLSKNEMDALYNSGGTIGKLRRPTQFGADTAEHMIVRNTGTEYSRKFRDTDQVLNYREGYFQIQYKAPKFVDEIVRDANGNELYRRAIAVAGDTKEAEFFKNRHASTQGIDPNDLIVRSDTRALAMDSDAWWDLSSASGRIAQRHRGKLLEDSSGLNHLGDGSYVMNPLDSAVRAAKSIGGRTVTRPMLEAAKARFIQQYGDLLPPNKMGGRSWPSNVSQISMKGQETSKQVADARTTYEYINYLENGYINTIDTVFKWGLNAVADIGGKIGSPKLERGAQAVGEVSPMSLGKNTVFMAYIGTNPLRQWLIQPHQILRTISYNPQGWASGTIPQLATNFLHMKSGLPMNPTAADKAFFDFMERSGLFDAVDKQNLVRGTLMEAADSSNTVIRNTKKYTTTLTRQIGFDIGEMGNLLGHAAAVYDRFRRQGRNLSDPAVMDDAISEIRAISYDMNFAGDMPYNQTSPSVVLQFMQVPHKAFLQMTNRRLDRGTRMRMAAADLIMWGGPTVLVADMLGVDVLPTDPFLKEAFVWGLESAMLNWSFTQLSGDKVQIDFSSLAPYDMTGWKEFFLAMYEGGMSEMVTNSPAGQLFLKDGGRAQNAVKTMGRFFGIVEDIDEDGTTFLNVMNEVAKISSGYSNAVKAKILLDAQKRYDQYGNTVDRSVNHVEAWAQLFGFTTADTRDLYRLTKEMSTDVKKHREEVMMVYNDIKRYYTEKLGVDNSDPVWITKVTGRVLKVFEDDPRAQAIIAQQLSQDLRGKDQALLELFMRRAEIPNLDTLQDQVMQMPVSDDEREKMLQIIKDVKNIRLNNKKD